MTEQPKIPVKTTDGSKGSSTPLARWDPAEVLENLQSELARFWGETWPFGPWATRRPIRRLFTSQTGWAPRMDVYQQNQQIVLQAELPGVKKEDVHISLEDGDLVIQGERKSESEVKEEDYYRMERSTGFFYRRLPLGSGVKPEQISARFADGVLELTIPVPASTRPPATNIPVA